MTGRRALRAAIIVATVVLGAVLVQRANAEFKIVVASSKPSSGWLLTYSRVRNALPWAGVAATLGAAGLVAADPRSRRRPWSAGAITVATAAFTTVLVIAFYLLSFPPLIRATNRDFVNLGDQLGIRVPGAVIGAWAALLLAPRRKRREPRELAGLLVGGIWILDIVLLILYGVIFG